MTLPQADIA